MFFALLKSKQFHYAGTSREAKKESEAESRINADLETLSTQVWGNEVDRPAINRWLENFDGSVHGAKKDRLIGAYLLSKFVYLGESEISYLCRRMYKGFIHRALLEEGIAGGTRARRTALDILDSTKFYCLGKPSESGALLLYYFRTTNMITIDAFLDPFAKGQRFENLCLVDDIAITGTQAMLYKESVRKINCSRRYLLVMITSERAKRLLEDSDMTVIAPIILSDGELNLG